MANPYATVSDLGTYLGKEPPAGSQRLLARAQDLVNASIRSAVYTVDTNGNPTDANVLAAFNKACCAQVEWWIAGGDEFESLERYSSFSIEGISATRSPESARRYRLCDRAVDALRSVISGLQIPVSLLPGKPVV